jgi:hypothetical protein
MLLTVDNAVGNQLYVGPGSTYTNIQDALNASQDGDEIHVANGTYNQNLTIHKNILLIGNSSVDCKIRVSHTAAILVDGASPAIVNLHLSTINDGNDVVKVINGGYLIMANCYLNFTGRFCYALNSDDGFLDAYNCTVDYFRKCVNAATGSWVTLVDTKVLPRSVEVDATSLLEVLYTIDLTVYYEDGTTPVDDADVNVSINGDPDFWLSYLTDHYGGGDAPTDLNGSAEVPMLSALYDGTSTPAWGFNSVKVYKSLPYKSGILEHEEIDNITDVNSTGSVDIIFSSDIRAPVKIDNVTVTTINQTVQNVTWDPTAEVGFLNYSVYSTDSVGGSKVLIANITDEWFEVTGLTPDTTYYYVVTVWDAAGLESPDSDVASNTTDAITGTVQGTAKFAAMSRASMNATIELLDSGNATIASTLIDDLAYNFTFLDVPLQGGLKVKATPEAAVLGEIGVKSGYLENTSADFELNATNMAETVDIVMEYYHRPFMISGKVTFSGGPEDGQNATEVTVELFQTLPEFNLTLNKTVNVTNEIMNTTSNETTGEYIFKKVPVGINYTIKVTPRDEDMYDGPTAKPGYDVTETNRFAVTEDMERNLTLVYKAISDLEVDLEGKITYRGGDQDQENATDAQVQLFSFRQEFNTTTNQTDNITDLIETVKTDANGDYSFSILPGFNFFLTVTPASSVQGEVDVKSGYMANTTNKFSVVGDTTLNVKLEWYEFLLPPLEIIDKAPTGENVSLDALIEIEFNQQVSQILLEMSLGTTPMVTGLSYAWNDENTSVRISHDDFEPGTTYNVTVSDDFTSKFLIGFPDNYTGNTWSFVTTTEGMVVTSVTITQPTSFDTFETGSSITVSGTSEGFEEGTVVTITLDDETVTTTIGADGTWTAEITAPDKEGLFDLTVEVGEESGQMTIVVEEEEKDEPYFTWAKMSACIIVFLVLMILALVVVVAVLGILLAKKREPKPGEEPEERVGKEEWEGEEDEEDWDDDEDWDDEDDEDDDWDDDEDDEDEDEDDDWDEDEDEEEEDEDDDWDEDEDDDDDDDEFGESEMDLDSMDDEDDDWDYDDDDDDYD